jgi:hypothetical protein
MIIKKTVILLSLSLLSVSTIKAGKGRGRRNTHQPAAQMNMPKQTIAPENSPIQQSISSAAEINQELLLNTIQEELAPVIVVSENPLDNTLGSELKEKLSEKTDGDTEILDMPYSEDQKQPTTSKLGILSWISDRVSGAKPNLLYDIEQQTLDSANWPHYRIEQAIEEAKTPALLHEAEANRLKNRVLGIKNPDLIELITILNATQTMHRSPESLKALNQELDSLLKKELMLSQVMFVELMHRINLIDQARSLTMPEESSSRQNSLDTIRKQMTIFGHSITKAYADAPLNESTVSAVMGIIEKSHTSA